MPNECLVSKTVYEALKFISKHDTGVIFNEVCDHLDIAQNSQEARKLNVGLKGLVDVCANPSGLPLNTINAKGQAALEEYRREKYKGYGIFLTALAGVITAFFTVFKS